MEIDYLRPASRANTMFRALSGDMIIENLWNVHGEIELGLVTEGRIILEATDYSRILHKGDMYFIAANQKHRIVNKDEAKIEIVLLNFSCTAASNSQEYLVQNISKSLALGSCTKLAVFTPSADFYEAAYECFRTIYCAELNQPNFYELLATGKTYELFFLLFKSETIKIYDMEAQSKKYRAMSKITEYINDNFCDNISLDTIAEYTGLSRYYISHLFKELMNTTFINYVNELRLANAAMLLSTTDIPIIEIAGKSGFNNISNFNRAFKLHYSMTPSKYRKLEKQKLYS